MRELARRYGISRNTVRVALRSEAPPAFRCPERPSKLDEFKDEIHELLIRDPRLTAVRVRELIEPLGFAGRQTIVNEYLREIRPSREPRFSTVRSHGRASRSTPPLWLRGPLLVFDQGGRRDLLAGEPARAARQHRTHRTVPCVAPAIEYFTVANTTWLAWSSRRHGGR